MFKSIKSRTILLQSVLMIAMLAVVFFVFLNLYDDYYFARKLNSIEKAYNYIQNSDISNLKYADKKLVKYREQNLKFLIVNENYKSIFEDERTKKYLEKKEKSEANSEEETNTVGEMQGEGIAASESESGETTAGETQGEEVTSATGENNSDGTNVEVNWGWTDLRIQRYIINHIDDYSEELTLKNKEHRICGYGIITQDGETYYVYIYETKAKMKINFSYSQIFLVITGLLAIVVGIFVSIWISNQISKPIKKIENTAKQAVDNNFEVSMDENQKIQELAGLSKSINVMLKQIRGQMESLEEEVARTKHNEERRRQFINNISHEMKTPLAIISSQAEMLTLIEDKDKQKEYADSIVEETTNMSEMINDMITIYSSQGDEEDISFEETDLSELVADTCDKYEDLFKTNGIKLNIHVDKDCVAKVNKRYITQAVDNYLTNAVKHCDSSGTVFVRVINASPIRIEVENQGEHIPDEYGKQIWDMFYKGDIDETLNGQQGSGMGLYLVKSIVEIHEGDCGYKNVPGGVVFWMDIPINKQ